MKPKGLLANAALRTRDEWLMMIVFHCAQDHFARKHVASLVRNDDPCIFIWIWAAVNPSPLWRLLTLRLGSQCTWGQDTIPAGSNLELCRRGSRQQREVHGVPLDLSPPARCTILLQVRPNLRKEFLLKSKSLRDSLRMCYWWNTSWAKIRYAILSSNLCPHLSHFIKSCMIVHVPWNSNPGGGSVVSAPHLPRPCQHTKLVSWCWNLQPRILDIQDSSVLACVHCFEATLVANSTWIPGSDDWHQLIRVSLVSNGRKELQSNKWLVFCILQGFSTKMKHVQTSKMDGKSPIHEGTPNGPLHFSRSWDLRQRQSSWLNASCSCTWKHEPQNSRLNQSTLRFCR